MVAANTAWLGQLQLPAHLSLSAGVLSEAIPALTASEQVSIAPMAPARLAEFAQGRMHARIALARFGLADASIPMGSKRAPLWPAGFVGSISHVPSDAATDQPGRVIAVVAHASDCAGLGVDIERSARLLPEHWNTFLSRRELAWLVGRPVAQRSTLGHSIWSAKEAAMKALRQALDPQDVEIEIDTDARTFVAICRYPDSARGRIDIRLSGRLASAPGWVAALAILS
jgi:4'-phosphopantetheinyl transferase EntD